MSNIALIVAGGVGQRTHQSIPKQFIHVKDKPIVVYTLEAFQQHTEIDAIELVCLEGWEEPIRSYAKQFGISKLENIVVGGENSLQSTRNGLLDIAKRHQSSDDIVLVHDAIRPMVSQAIISDAIRVCRNFGNAVSVIPCTSVMLETSDALSSESQIPRDNLKITQTPQAFYLADLLDAHKEAQAQGINDSIASCSLYVELGRKLYLSLGSEKNIKITTAEDIEIFTSLLEAERPQWIRP